MRKRHDLIIIGGGAAAFAAATKASDLGKEGRDSNLRAADRRSG